MNRNLLERARNLVAGRRFSNDEVFEMLEAIVISEDEAEPLRHRSLCTQAKICDADRKDFLVFIEALLQKPGTTVTLNRKFTGSKRSSLTLITLCPH